MPISEPEILVVSSSAASRAALCSRLSLLGYRSQPSPSMTEAQHALQDGPCAVILVDVELFEACSTVPVIVMVGPDDPVRSGDALRRGAAELLAAPFDDHELGARVRSVLTIARLHERVRGISQRDGLTGLFNRRWVDERIAAELERARRHPRPLSIALLDLDHFRPINRAHGRDFGDGVLRLFADLTRKELREPDACARYGGQEFVVVFPETLGDAAGAALERLRRAASRVDWGLPDDLHVTFSAGVACSPVDADSVAELLAKADEALHAAKAAGRDRICRSGFIPAPRLELLRS